jgi:hypothetical protein
MLTVKVTERMVDLRHKNFIPLIHDFLGERNMGVKTDLGFGLFVKDV